MNISRNANIDKFVNIRYIFLLARRAYIQLIISVSPNVEITSPGRLASGFFNPWAGEDAGSCFYQWTCQTLSPFFLSLFLFIFFRFGI